MHIVDGALSREVLIVGSLLAAGGVAIGVRKLSMERIPAAGVLGATFFVASLVHIPVPPTSVHLIMNGLAGLVLGWVAFPTLLLGLLLQAVFFGFGGITVLGVNSLNIAGPAVIVSYLCRPGAMSANPTIAAAWGAAAGAGAIVLTTLFVAVSLWFSGQEFVLAAQVVFFAHIPVMIIEGAVCAAAVYLIRRVNPELFGAIAQIRPVLRAAKAPIEEQPNA